MKSPLAGSGWARGPVGGSDGTSTLTFPEIQITNTFNLFFSFFFYYSMNFITFIVVQ